MRNPFKGLGGRIKSVAQRVGGKIKHTAQKVGKWVKNNKGTLARVGSTVTGIVGKVAQHIPHPAAKAIGIGARAASEGLDYAAEKWKKK
jgi:hypothetical protein